MDSEELTRILKEGGNSSAVAVGGVNAYYILESALLYSEIVRHSPLFRNSASICIPGTIYKKVQTMYVFIIMTKKAKHNN